MTNKIQDYCFRNVIQRQRKSILINLLLAELKLLTSGKIKEQVVRTNQHVQCPKVPPRKFPNSEKVLPHQQGLSGGEMLPGTSFRPWFLRCKHTEYHPKVPVEGSCSGNAVLVLVSSPQSHDLFLV